VARGAGTGGLPDTVKITPAFVTAYTLWKAGELTAVKAMKEAGMSKSVWYRKVQEYEKATV
jgi:hypothetical protein